MLNSLKEQEGFDFPNLYVSMDNGFCKPELFAVCEKELGITLISVPKKNWLFEIDGRNISLKDYIKELLEEEAKQQTAKRKDDILPHRKRAYRKGFGEVLLLFFRLKKGKEANVIMTPQLDIFSKTLRRRCPEASGLYRAILSVLKTYSQNTGDQIHKP